MTAHLTDEPLTDEPLTDEQFISALEACLLPPRCFDHAAHVRAGYAYLCRLTFPDAIARMCRTIKRYADSMGKTGLYHETITIAFMALIQERLQVRGAAGGWNGFAAENPELLRKEALLAYYPRAVLDSPAARRRLVLLPRDAEAGTNSLPDGQLPAGVWVPTL